MGGNPRRPCICFLDREGRERSVTSGPVPHLRANEEVDDLSIRRKQSARADSGTVQSEHLRNGKCSGAATGLQRPPVAHGRRVPSPAMSNSRITRSGTAENHFFPGRARTPFSGLVWRSAISLIAGSLLAVPVACGSTTVESKAKPDAGDQVCKPGETRACVGPAACTGGQVCVSAGTWSGCDCGAGGGTGGSAGSGGAGASSAGGGGANQAGSGGAGGGVQPDAGGTGAAGSRDGGADAGNADAAVTCAGACACANLNSDPNNCGACGRRCADGCENGDCKPVFRPVAIALGVPTCSLSCGVLSSKCLETCESPSVPGKQGAIFTQNPLQVFGTCTSTFPQGAECCCQKPPIP